MGKIDAKNRIEPFTREVIEAISRVLGRTYGGLTGPEIGDKLQACSIPDVAPTDTKWRRIANALIGFQNQYKVGNHILKFIQVAMNPANYTSDPVLFETLRGDLNRALAFCGMLLGKDGKVRRTAVAADLDDALARANRFHSALTQRAVHDEVFRYCTVEIIQENYFHAVLEAIKSITAKIRSLSGLTSDGASLVDEAFGLGKAINPILAINSLSTETEQGEQRGFASLLKGLYGTTRNPLAHEPKIEWQMSEQDALDTMTLVSLIHRKLDKTRKR